MTYEDRRLTNLRWKGPCDFNKFLHIVNLLILHLFRHIYCHPQTDCFFLSELFSVARHVGRSKPGSKPIQLYVRLSLKPLGQQAYHVLAKGVVKVFMYQQKQPFVYIFIPFYIYIYIYIYTHTHTHVYM